MDHFLVHLSFRQCNNTKAVTPGGATTFGRFGQDGGLKVF
jgi:hypothetical protein